MIAISPEDAAEVIRSGRTSDPMQVAGRIDLTKFHGETLPAGLHCYELDLTESNIRSLPADLRIQSRVVLDNCRDLTELPAGFATGSISMRNCVSLRALPEGLSTWFLDMTACSRFEQWPGKGSIHNGSLTLRNCVGIESLPSWIGRLSQLNVAGCTGLAQIPEGIEVSSWVDIGGSGIRRLPRSLQGTALRWRGVRVDERIAFHPELLTAKEALEQKNAELRRVMIERMGYLRFATEAGAKLLDKDIDAGGRRQLLRIELQEDEPLVGLACCCPSTGRQYFLRVPPQMKTCHQAAAWMAGYDDPSQYSPRIET